jgi:hypothetical protein
MKKLNMLLVLSLNEYNAIGEFSQFKFLEHTVSRDSKCSILFPLGRGSFDANIKAGLGLASLIYGKQEINGTFLTLVRKRIFRSNHSACYRLSN